MNNKEIAKVFRDIAALLELNGENPFKIRAYRKIVRSVEHLPVEVEQLEFMRFGAEVAKRGWCEAQDILNTKPLKEVLACLAS